MKIFKVCFYVPEDHCDKVCQSMFAQGAGEIGNYDFCCWKIKGEGQFRPLDKANPHLGKKNQVEKLSEYKVEMVCSQDKIEKVIQAMKSSHPYETPAYQVFACEDI